MSTNDVHQIHHLSAAYALDALDPRERAAFEAHYDSCDICSADVRSFRAVLAEVADVQPVQPPDAVRAAVLADIASTRQLSPLLPDGVADLAARRRPQVFTRVVAVAAALLLVVGAVAFLAGRSTVSGDPVAAALESVLAQPDAQSLSLDPQDGATGTVRVTWSPTTGQVVVLGDALTTAATGRAYELWAISAAGTAQPMRLLDPAAGGTIRAVLDLDADLEVWGMTDEPAAGSPAPTTPILFATA
jgi:anti-sigma-K factor RskA